MSPGVPGPCKHSVQERPCPKELPISTEITGKGGEGNRTPKGDAIPQRGRFSRLVSHPRLAGGLACLILMWLLYFEDVFV